MTRPLAQQLFTVLLGSTLHTLFTEQKVLMSLMNLHKHIERGVTGAGNPTIQIQHESFHAILLFNERTQLLSNALVRLHPYLFEEMSVYARSCQWLETHPIPENTQVQCHYSEVDTDYRLALLHTTDKVCGAFVDFFDYPGAFDAHTVHFRRDVCKSGKVAAPESELWGKQAVRGFA